MTRGKAHEPSDVSLEVIAASSGICQRVLDGFEISVEWALCIMVPVHEGKGYIRNHGCYRAVKISGHGMKVVERVLEKSLYRMVTADEMRFVFMSERGTIDAVFIFLQWW